MDSDSQQLNLFELPEQPAPAHRGIGRIRPMQLRSDHAVLLLILGLVGISVVFAVGIERGKRLTKDERALTGASVAFSRESIRAESKATLPQEAPASASTNSESQTAGSAPVSTPTPKEHRTAPKKLVEQRGKFAIQIVSYSQPSLAQQELTRLQQRGETAFLIRKDSRIVLLIGPFSTKHTASVKLADIRQRYRDCFIRNL